MLPLAVALPHRAWAQQRPRLRVPPIRSLATVRDSTRADSVRRKLVQIDQRKWLDSLRAFTRRKTVMGRAASVVFDFRTRREDDRGLDAALLNRQYDQHRFKVVRRIDITSLDAFGYSLDDLTRRPTRFWEKAGNAAHIITHRGVVRRSLLFRTGEELEPQALAESERLLRQTPHLLDARVIVNEATTTADSVDIIVITKDVFSLSVSGAAAPGSERYSVGLGDDNFLGMGHQVAFDYSGGYDQPQTWRTQADYRIENLARGFVTGLAHYRDQFGLRNAGIGVERGFVTLDTRWAGAAHLDWYDELIGGTYVVGDTVPRLPHVAYGVQDFWLGRSYGLRTYDLDRPNPARLITAGRIINTGYGRTSAEAPALRNRTLVLGAVGLSYRRYYKDRYLFGFGRTEDIPAGNLFTLTAGYERGELVNRPYFGAKAAIGHYRPHFGYLYASAEFGGYRQGERWQQSLLNLETLYFTRLNYVGAWPWRQFFWLRAAIGIHRQPQEQLTVNQVDGLRGFSSGLLRGQRRVVFNYESNLFTPVSFLGFRLATIVFADVAWLAPNSQTSPFKSPPYAGIGLGIRFRNEFVAFRTIQLLLGYYPRRPLGEDLQSLRIYEASRPFVTFRDLGLTQPTTSDFR